MRIVVIGGRGHLGSRAVATLSREPGVEVVAMSRRTTPRINLRDPATFAALAGADVIVNVSSSHDAPPDALARHCLDQGLVLIEASSDREVMERLLDAHRGKPAKGALVLGAGIFTGISNALARAAVDAVPGADTVAIGVRSSPFSGAGGGTVDLMADALAVATRSIERGARIETPPVAPGPALPFVEGTYGTLHVPFAEPVMVHASTKVPNVAMYMAPAPSILRLAFLALPLALVRTRLFGGFLRVYFSLLRRFVLKRVSTRVGLLARASHGTTEKTIALSFDDGFLAGGAAIAATALAITRLPQRPTGTFVVDELVPLAPMLDGVRTLAPSVRIESRGA
jgi:hypothetical protein